MAFYENRVCCVRVIRIFFRFSDIHWSFQSSWKAERCIHLRLPQQQGSFGGGPGLFYLFRHFAVRMLLNSWRQAPEQEPFSTTWEAAGGPGAVVLLRTSPGRRIRRAVLRLPTLGQVVCVAGTSKGQFLQLEQSMWKEKLLKIHLIC